MLNSCIKYSKNKRVASYGRLLGIFDSQSQGKQYEWMKMQDVLTSKGNIYEHDNSFYIKSDIAKENFLEYIKRHAMDHSIEDTQLDKMIDAFEKLIEDFTLFKDGDYIIDIDTLLNY